MLYKLNKLTVTFEKYVKNAMHEWKVPGIAIAVVKGNSIIYVKGFGTKKTGCNSPVDSKTVFQIGSISKSFTAALVSILADEGKLSWNDKVRDHLPNFKLNDPHATSEFTIEDLMSQRSGLPPHSGLLLPHLGYDRNFITNAIRFIKPSGRFRNDYAYQNNLFLVAAGLIEKYSGTSWEQNLFSRILEPLGMASTTATLKGYQRSVNTALGHYYSGPEPGKKVTTIPLNWPYHYWIYTVAPAGGINSNVIDMARWLELHLNLGNFRGQRLLTEDNVLFMHSPKIQASIGYWEETRCYCEGWVHSEYKPYPILWHNGGTSGMKSMAAMVPEECIGIVILSNLYESFVPEALCRFWFDLWFGNPLIDWSLKLLRKQATVEGLQAPPVAYTPPRPLKNYTGTYYNNLYGPITIAKDNRSLTVTMGPRKIRKKFKHWGGDTFVLYWPGVLTSGSGVQFYSDKYGRVDKVEIAGMNDDITGVFIKTR